MRTALILLLVAAAPAAAQDAGASKEGERLYQRQCATCHEAGAGRAPQRSTLSRLTPETIRFALTKGTMAAEGAKLTSAEADTLVRYLAAASATPAPASSPACPADQTPFAEPFAKPRWNGWGADLSQTRFQPASMAQLTAAQVPRLALKWAFGVPGVGQMSGQPTVAGGRIFIGSTARKVYSLSAANGCQHWAFDTDYPVRTAISVGAVGGNWAVYFGDQHSNAYAVNALTGQLLWKTRVEEHVASFITGAPTLAGGKLYVPTSSGEEVYGADPKYPCCTFRGSVTALDAASGKVLWKSYTIPEEPRPGRPNKQGTPRWGPSGAAVWSSPTVDLKTQRVYVTTGDSYSDPAASTADSFVAFDAETGKLVWSRQMTAGDAFTVDCDFPDFARANCPDANGPDFDFGSSPILIELSGGRRALVAGQKSGMVHAVDPDRQGEVLWQTRVGKGGRLGGVQWGSAADGERIYAAVSDAEIRPAPDGTPGAQKSLLGSLAFDPTAGGGLSALKRETGEIVWKTSHPGCQGAPGCSPAQSAAVTAIPGVVFSGGIDGHLRAYDASSGRIVWDVDTKREYTTVNGVKANGGSLDGPGAVVVGGMLFVNSGYAYLASLPGNVLLAFSVDGK